MYFFGIAVFFTNILKFPDLPWISILISAFKMARTDINIFFWNINICKNNSIQPLYTNIAISSENKIFVIKQFVLNIFNETFTKRKKQFTK